MGSKRPIKSVFILGSTSQVAVSICLELARQGCKRFFLLARNKTKNQNLVNQLRFQYDAYVTEEYLDLRDEKYSKELSIRKLNKFDLYLFTAGFLGDQISKQMTLEEELSVIKVNFSSLIPWLSKIVDSKRIDSPGKLWIFSSVASDRGRPSNYQYGAAKAALNIFCEGLYMKCRNKPFSIRIIKAGYMKTPMARGAPSLLCISTDKVAKYLVNTSNRQGIEYFPRWWRIIMSLIKILPPTLVSKL